MNMQSTSSLQPPFRRQFLARMLALPVLDFGVVAIYIWITSRYDVIPKVVGSLALLGASAWVIGHWLFQPVQRFADGTGSADDATRRIQNLPKFAGWWAFGLVLLYCFTMFALKVYVADESKLNDIPVEYATVAILWYATVYASFYAYFVYFVISDLTITMRRHFRDRLTFSPQNASGNVRLGLARKFGVTVAITSFLPLVLVMLDLTLFSPIRDAQGLSTFDVILLDLIAIGYIIGASILFVSRSQLEPARELFAAQDQVTAGDLSAKAAVLTDDELGEVTSRFNTMVVALRERELMKTALHRYLTPSVARELIEGGGAIESKSVEATVMFTDIAGFTSLSETLTPQETVDLLNAYFSVMNRVIHEGGGTVNNFVGDAVVAIFNVPDPNLKHARAAVETAIAIQAALARTEFTLSTGKKVNLPTRIGLNTGFVCAGSIGSAERQGYTVYGDAVNLAARIEPLNKKYGTRILASESTVLQALAQGLEQSRVEPIERTQVAGRQEAVMVYRVMGG
ncbi:MAG: adenylate/guanylate cyclase domain-containing protein [Betaproteobacteria bacterium]|nr:adenylate/guanylate cyclase domain-containing protein [Betaproteobacteria bacterium]